MDIPNYTPMKTLTCPHGSWKVFKGDEILPPWDILKTEYDLKDFFVCHTCDILRILQDKEGIKTRFFYEETSNK